MRKRLSQIRNMLTTVKQFFTNNSAIFTSHPALNALITVYLNKLTLIDQKLIELGEVASGKMDEKEAARAFLQDEYAEIYASNLYMFGKNSGNGTIAEICDVKEWQFDQMPDPEFIDKCTAIHSIAVNKVAELADYNITAEKNTSFNNKIQEFDTKFNVRKLSVKERKTLNEEVDLLIRSTAALLKDEMDRLISNIRKDHPTECAAYFHAREIVDLPSRSNGESDTPPNPNPEPPAPNQ